MNENAKKWVAALRSGKYKQTQQVLHDKKGFCCLGVACDVSGLGQWEDYKGLNEFGEEEDFLGYFGRGKQLPYEVREWLGLRHEAGGVGSFTVPGDHAPLSLAQMNDAGAKFEDIADCIEVRAELLFES